MTKLEPKEFGAWNTAEDRAAWFATLGAECDCGMDKQIAADPSIRDRHGVESHSPYCPVGKVERGGPR